MSFKNAFINIAKDTNLDKKDICKTLDFINTHTDCFSLPPTNKNEISSRLISILCNLVVFHVECFYGETETNFLPGAELGRDLTLDSYTEQGLSHDEAVIRINRSRVATLTKDPNKFGIFISRCCNTWEDVFYDLCHECLHILNPAKDTNITPVQRLEEGVAVKLAEYMYSRYIANYHNTPAINSPLSLFDPTAKYSQYYKSYLITSKIPDEKLKEVRSIFGSFWSIPDKEKFMSIVGNYITDKEADYLLSDFDYNRP